MIKGSIQEEDITILNIYAPNIGAPQYIRGEMDSNTIIVGDFNTPLTPMDRSSKQKINKETQVLDDTLDEMDLIDIFTTFHPNAKDTLSSQVHIEHSPGQTTSWVKSQTTVNLRKLKSYQASLQPQHYKTAYQLQEKKKKTLRNTNTWRLNNTFLNNQELTEEIKREVKTFLETNDNEITTT